ncbi:hypothetical protein [Sanguibacter antarcticus]|uniref:Uncharacterized protein n=1 Tax=Sanguibacter antarcticus TaxID=372484 RepID=A0A2A9E815_9MICO|nr:hypothetical protein [Sanguibacter antarcticus]PFG35004.1 hypothetical protein ATL42_2936 [Sanguibacter antarcticus]
MADLDKARHAKLRLRSELADRDGIRGVGISRGDDGYRVQVNVLSASDNRDLPATVEGVPVLVRVCGRIHAGG